jgi:hypothetical protein
VTIDFKLTMVYYELVDKGNSTKMANRVKPKNPPNVTVKFAETMGVDFYKELLVELSRVLKTNHIFTSDPVTLSIFSGCNFDSYNLKRRYEKFIIGKIEKSFGCYFPDKLFSRSILETCDHLKNNRTNSPVKSDPSHFLGVLFLEELATKDFYHLSHPSLLVDHVNYFSGWIFGKTNPLNGSEEMKSSIMKDFESMKQKVCGKFDSPQWRIKTEEGDTLLFNNLYEVYCWLIARASNYSVSAMTKECW